EAERQEARFEHVQSQLARARVGRLLGWPRADQEEAEALDAQAALGLDRDTTRAEREALLLADRCAALLIAGQNIFSARTRSPILDAVRQAVLSLLPAGRCVILDATLLLLSGPTDVHYSRSVAQHAIESGRPVEAIDDRIADAGSTLCVPFVVRDAPGG